jgi:hypothetical protein
LQSSCSKRSSGISGNISTGNLEAISAALTQATLKLSKGQALDLTAETSTPTPVPTKQMGRLLAKNSDRMAPTSLEKIQSEATRRSININDAHPRAGTKKRARSAANLLLARSVRPP